MTIPVFPLVLIPVFKINLWLLTPILKLFCKLFTDVLNPEREIKSLLEKLWGRVEIAIYSLLELKGKISNPDIVVDATLIFVADFPKTLDTFAFAFCDPCWSLKIIESFTWYPNPPVTIPIEVIFPLDTASILIVCAFILFGCNKKS